MALRSRELHARNDDERRTHLFYFGSVSDRLMSLDQFGLKKSGSVQISSYLFTSYVTAE